MKWKDRRSTRRKILKTTGKGIASVSIIGTATQPVEGARNEGDSNERSSDGDVSPEAINSVSVTFDDYEISVSDTTIMTCEWEVNNYLAPCDIYNLDAHIDYSGMSEPETVSAPSDFSGDWEYTETGSPSGEASWRCLEDGLILCDGTFTLEAEVDPSLTGEYKAYCGASAFAVGDYSKATLTVV